MQCVVDLQALPGPMRREGDSIELSSAFANKQVAENESLEKRDA
jgi:hypothetical protein